MELFADNWPVMLMVAYVFWDWRTQQKMREELEKQRLAAKAHREEVDAIWAEQESINSGLHKFLLQSEHPGAVALRERVESLQAKIVRARSREAP